MKVAFSTAAWEQYLHWQETDARKLPARLGIDVVAVEADQRPFPGGQTDAIEVWPW